MKKYKSIILLVSLCFSMLITLPSLTAQQVDYESDEDVEASSCVDIPTKLQYQSRDTRTTQYVTLLQDFLNDTGYLSSQPTGFFGAGTRKAVKAFQKANGISQTGSLGINTRAKIKELSCTLEEGNESDDSYVTSTCNSSQSLVNGVCVTMTRTCPDGRVIAVSRSCDAATTGGAVPSSIPPCATDPKGYYYYYNPDVKSAGVDAKKHWNEFGMKEGRKSCWAGVQQLPTSQTSGGVAAQGVPVVTLKATPFSSAGAYPGDLVLLTWTASNNPSYCTGIDGGKSFWNAGRKFLPSDAPSYSQLIDLSEYYMDSTDYKFGITCTNTYGTSQAVYTELRDTKKIYGTHAGPANSPDNWPAAWPAAWKNAGLFPFVSGHRQVDDAPQIEKYNSRSVRDIINAGSDVKICKRSFPRQVESSFRNSKEDVGGQIFIIANPTTSPPCTESSDFVTLMGQPGWGYNHPNNPILRTGGRDVFTASEIGGYTSYNNLSIDVFLRPSDVLREEDLYFSDGRPVPLGHNIKNSFPENQFYVLKSSNGGVFAGAWGYVGGFGEEYGNAWSKLSTGPTVTKLTATSLSSNKVKLTWSSTNSPDRCYAYPNEVEGWGGTVGSLKSAPVSNGTRSQTLTVTKPGVYTFDISCMNAYSIGVPVSATVTVE